MPDKKKAYFNKKKKAIPAFETVQVQVSPASSFTESIRSLCNPGCGWYQIYSFNLAEDSPLYIACEEEQLVLLRIDIHAYRAAKQIPEDARNRLDQILTFFAEHDKGIILRIVYDTDGHGMEHEPSSINLVKGHMTQLGSIISRHRGEILVHQGIFVGSWGEMHSSQFLSIDLMTELIQTLSDAIGGVCPIAVRKPVQLRSIVAQLKQKTAQETPVSLTLFNDGIFGSETDLGTYVSRKDELNWQQKQMQRSFIGGEAIGISEAIKEVSIVSDLSQMHVSYLNSIYRQELLAQWKIQKTMWNGEAISVYDYIGRHLGYRFTVTQAKLVENTIQIMIRNTGFANLCEEAVCKILLVSPQVVEQMSFEQKIQQEIMLNCDPCTWDSGSRTAIECRIPAELWQSQKLQKQACCFYLQLTRKRDGRLITFANENTDAQLGLLLFQSPIV